MVLMSGSKAARHIASSSNRGCHYGTLAGLAPTVGVNTSTRQARKRSGADEGIITKLSVCSSFSIAQLTNPTTGCADQKAALTECKLLSVNPVGSGGVGKKQLFLRFGNRGGSAHTM